jgi:hypothetical protein
MPTIKDQETRPRRRPGDVEAAQVELRHSIAVTERMVDESNQMLRRHREEANDGGAKAAKR